MQVTAKMEKTPVSNLQELAVKHCSNIPKYTIELYGDCFKCKVECFGKQAVGVGTGKQAAKHDAAKHLLKLIHFNDDQITKVEESRGKNFVGALQNFCVKYRLRAPQYEELLDGYAASISSFTIKCTVDKFTAEGTGKNKKSAKQNAAKSLLNQLEGCKSLDLVTKSSHSSINTRKIKESDNNATVDAMTPKKEDTHSNFNSEDNHNLSLAYNTQKEPESNLYVRRLQKYLQPPFGRRSNTLSFLDSKD